jgi:polyribonucleotide 5'-hydroxyl-kinase
MLAPAALAAVAQAQAQLALTAGASLVPSGAAAAQPQDPAAARIRQLGPGSELRIIVDDDKHAKVKLIKEEGQRQNSARQQKLGLPPAATAEMFGAELVPGTEYLLLGGTRTAIFTWHGCKIQISGPTNQEYDAPNVVMRDYLNCAAVFGTASSTC